MNKGFAAFFGKGGAMDFDNPEFVAKLAHKPKSMHAAADPYAELRRAIYHCFRPPQPSVSELVDWPHVWPWIYGDAFGSFPDNGPGNMLSMTGLQELLLRRWVEGRFGWAPRPSAGRGCPAPPRIRAARQDRRGRPGCRAR